MATNHPVDCTEYVHIDHPKVSWRIYVLEENSLNQTFGENEFTLPEFSSLLRYKEDNFFFLSNLTLKEVDKPIILHWNGKSLPLEEVIEERCLFKISELHEIHVENEFEEFIVMNPRTFAKMEQIYNKLKSDSIFVHVPDTVKILDALFAKSQMLKNIHPNRFKPVIDEKYTPSEGILKVLESFSLNMNAIGSLSFTDMIKIRNDTINSNEPTDASEIPYHMLKKLLLHRHDSRELSSKSIALTIKVDKSDSIDYFQSVLCEEEDDENIHPMDVFLLLLFQCNDLAKQMFIENVAKCQNSIPLITKSPIYNKFMMYDFALSSVKKQCVVNDRVKEFRIVNENMPIVSFCKFGTAKKHSKSKMLNAILGVHHNYFFNREVSGSSKTSHLFAGTIEIGWHLPKKKGNLIDLYFAILNLRGNALNYPTQIAFLTKASAVMYIYISLIHMSSEEWDFLKDIVRSNGNRIVLVIEERCKQFNYDIKLLENFQMNKNTLLVFTENIANNEKHIKDSIRYFLELKFECYSINQLTAFTKEFGILTESQYIGGYDIIPSIVDNIFEPCITKSSNENISPIILIKRDELKLQGLWWRDWAYNKRCIHRIKISDEGIEKQTAKHTALMDKSRKEQIEHLKTFDHYFLTKIILYLSECYNGEQFSLLFFRLLKSYFEDLALVSLPALYQALKEENYIYNKENSTNRKEIQQIVDQISDSSLGEEHIMRELAQIFEATSYLLQVTIPVDNHIDQNFSYSYNVFQLPRIAAKLVLSGIPFEILDGDVSQIPIRWIKSVFRELHTILEEKKKVYIISILGIQSSGKSTLLNAIFGLQFPVSLGRCTRGAFMQLVPIEHTLSLEIGYDFLMVIDTEGLRGIEQQSSSSHLRDNELATFAIGLANLTIININGENQSDMQDILQITVSALIRMTEVDINPKCIFVHQNIASENAEDKLLLQRSIFIGLLDEMTAFAAKQEELGCKYQRFSDVIGFNPSDVFYFPGLLGGEPPMAPVNISYCEEAEDLRKKIFYRISKSLNEFYYIHNIGDRIDEIWSSIMKEDFVFHFRNTLDLNLTIELEVELAKWESNLTQVLSDWETKHLNVLSRLAGDDLERYWQTINPKIDQECNSCCICEQEQIIMNFFEYHKLKKLIQQKRIDVEDYFQSTRSKQCNIIHRNFTRIYQDYYNNQNIDNILNNVENQLLQDIRELYSSHKQKANQDKWTDDLIEEIFSNKWDELSQKFPTETTELIDIKQAIQNFFHGNEVLRSVTFAQKECLIGNKETYEEFGRKERFEIQKGTHYENIRQKIRNPLPENTKTHNKQKDIHSFLNLLQIKCQELINSLLSKDINFTPNAFTWILDLVIKEVNQRNVENRGKNENDRNYTLTTSLIHDFTFFQCCKQIPHFERLQLEFHHNSSIKTKVENKKEQFKKYFFSLWKGVQDEQCSANELATLIFGSITESANRLMDKEIAELYEKERVKGSTKYDIQLEIFMELCVKEEFDSYKRYLQDPFGYISAWFESRMESFYTIVENKEIILRICSKYYDDVVNSTIDSAKIATDKITKEGIDDMDSDTKLFWRREFLKLIHSNIPNISDTKLVIFDAYDIQNYDTFFQAFTNQLTDKCGDEIIEIPKDFGKYSKKIIDRIVQCRECCPFCNEICQRNRLRHDHYCNIFHRPLGLIGVKDSQNQLVSDSCPIVLHSNKEKLTFECSIFPNNDLKELNIRKKSWKIHSKEAIDTKYWIWVFNRFQLQFEREYSASPIPDNKLTHIITKGEILGDLNERANKFGNSTYSPETEVNQGAIAQFFQKMFSFFSFRHRSTSQN